MGSMSEIWPSSFAIDWMLDGEGSRDELLVCRHCGQADHAGLRDVHGFCCATCSFVAVMEFPYESICDTEVDGVWELCAHCGAEFCREERHWRAAHAKGCPGRKT